ncbi:pilus assembly protein TadE [Caulobacter vibrioides]|nr:pilus assembly protein TadE [Caulobacter vibrioides]
MGKSPVSLHARLKLAARRRLGRFARAENGATAVEFALLLGPFLLLFFGLIELALVYFASMTLENATIEAGRQIRTGEVQTSGDNSAAGFKTRVCARMNWLESTCASRLRVDVRTVSTFTSSSGLTTPNTTCWDPGGPSSLVLVRTYYDWPLITPLLASALQTSNGKRTLGFTTAFANEPYNSSAAAAVSCPA